MMYKQTKLFYEDKAGNVPGLCLANTRKGYGIDPKYADAWTAWLNTEQHKDRNFPPLFVPIYFSYTTTIGGIKKNYGHIGVRYPDGRFWSDGKLYDSLSAYTSGKGRPTFVGWGESINNVAVISAMKGEEMVTVQQLEVLYRFYMGSGVSAYGMKNRLGKQTFEQAQAELMGSPEFAALVEERKETQIGFPNHLPSRIRKVMKFKEQK